MSTDPPSTHESHQLAPQDVSTAGRPFDDEIQVSHNPPPAWWKWVFIGTIAFSALYFPFHHPGAPGRSDAERYAEALSENMRLQFAELGDLQPTEATLVRMMNDRRWLRVGESVYRTHCASCHGIDGGGIVGPNLADDHYKHVRTIGDILRVVQHGAAGGAMPPWRTRLHLNEQILVSSYVAALRGTAPTSPRGPEGNEIPPWPDEIIEEAADEPREEQPGEEQPGGVQPGGNRNTDPGPERELTATRPDAANAVLGEPDAAQ
jgi:cytochrome c oxidase cbb3-type subunit III